MLKLRLLYAIILNSGVTCVDVVGLDVARERVCLCIPSFSPLKCHVQNIMIRTLCNIFNHLNCDLPIFSFNVYIYYLGAWKGIHVSISMCSLWHTILLYLFRPILQVCVLYLFSCVFLLFKSRSIQQVCAQP